MYILAPAPKEVLNLDHGLERYNQPYIDILTADPSVTVKTARSMSLLDQYALYSNFQEQVIKYMEMFRPHMYETALGVYYILQLRDHYFAWYQHGRYSPGGLKYRLYSNVIRVIDLEDEPYRIDT